MVLQEVENRSLYGNYRCYAFTRKNCYCTCSRNIINTTMVERFSSRFKENIAILHSRLNDGEKYDEYRKIARGEVK